MVIKRGRFGEFLACSRYPECKTTSPISLGVDCPKPGCGGYLTEKRSRRGKVFFGCSNYSQDAVRLRVVGSPGAAAVPEVRRQVRRPEGQQGRRAHPLHRRRLRLHRRPGSERAGAPKALRREARAARRRHAVAADCRTGTRKLAATSTERRVSRARQRRDRLDVPRLREHVERLHAQAGVAGGGQRRDVARLRLGVARARRRSCAARRRRAARGSRRRSPCAAGRR